MYSTLSQHLTFTLYAASHYAIRDVRKREREIINERFADTILNNQSRNFWDEVKKIGSSSKGRSSLCQ